MTPETTVMVFGTFDILHEGHRSLFAQAKTYGTRLIVVVGRDATVAHIKHHSALHSEAMRLAAVLAEKDVDLAVLGDPRDYYTVIETYRPQVICLGYDQHSSIAKHLQDELVRRGISAKIIHLAPFHPEKYKSSLLRGRMDSA
jgi:FAD synthetase